MADRKSAERLAALEALLQSSATGCVFLDPDLVVTALNPSLAAINGLDLGAQSGRSIADVVPQLWPSCEPLCRRLLDGSETELELEIDALTSAELTQPRRWRVRGFPVDSGGAVIGLGLVIADVTDAKWVADERRRLASIVAGSGDAIFGATVDGVVTSWNAAAERLYGYTAAEIIGRPVDVLAPADRANEPAQIRARLSSGAEGHARLETRRRRKDGSEIEVLVIVSTMTDEAGAVLGLSVIAHDISERREVQQALEASERRLAEAQQIAHLGSFEFDMVTHKVEWSAEYYKIVGLDPGLSATGEMFYAMVHPDDRPAMRQAWVDGMARCEEIDAVFRIVRPDAEIRSVRLHAVPESREDGEIVKVIGTLADETERLAADRVRRAAETGFEVGFQQAGIGAVILNLRGIPIRVNDATCRLLGRPPELLV